MQKWVNNLPLRFKMITANSTINTLLFFIAVIGAVSILQYKDNIQKLYTNNLLTISRLERMQTAVYKLRSDVLAFIYVPEMRE